MPRSDSKSASKKTAKASGSVVVAAHQKMIPDFLMKLFGKIPKVGGNLKPEDKECIEFARRCFAWTLAEQLDAVWCHVANEFAGDEKPIYGALKTAMGRVKGAADYFFLCKNSFVLEFKSLNGKQSENQIAFEKWCKAQGIPYHVVFTANEAESYLRQYGILRV